VNPAVEAVQQRKCFFCLFLILDLLAANKNNAKEFALTVDPLESVLALPVCCTVRLSYIENVTAWALAETATAGRPIIMIWTHR